jgi:hypothetical protein
LLAEDPAEIIGQFLPLAIMTLLLLHSALGTAAASPSGPWPELQGRSAGGVAAVARSRCAAQHTDWQRRLRDLQKLQLDVSLLA